MSEWQPIETAPKEVEVIVWDKRFHEAMVAELVSTVWFVRDSSISKYDATFTHWMPMPESPNVPDK